MNILIILGVMMLAIFALVVTSWQISPAINSNYLLSPQITTVIIPPGVENPSSYKTYEPKYIHVVIGVNNTVKWINDGIYMNGVVADNQTDPDFFDATNKQTYLNFQGSSKLPNFLKQGESFEYTFTKVGYFGYHDEPGPWVRGWITVSLS